MELLDIIDNKEIKILENNKEILESSYSKLIFRYAKFIVVSRGDEYYVIFFKILVNHIDVVMRLYKNKFNFIGAGYFIKEDGDYKVWFDSETCELSFNYDRPKTEKEQNFVLKNIKKTLKNLFEIFS